MLSKVKNLYCNLDGGKQDVVIKCNICIYFSYNLFYLKG